MIQQALIIINKKTNLNNQIETLQTIAIFKYAFF